MRSPRAQGRSCPGRLEQKLTRGPMGGGQAEAARQRLPFSPSGPLAKIAQGLLFREGRPGEAQECLGLSFVREGAGAMRAGCRRRCEGGGGRGEGGALDVEGAGPQAPRGRGPGRGAGLQARSRTARPRLC